MEEKSQPYKAAGSILKQKYRRWEEHEDAVERKKDL